MLPGRILRLLVVLAKVPGNGGATLPGYVYLARTLAVTDKRIRQLVGDAEQLGLVRRNFPSPGPGASHKVGIALTAEGRAALGNS